MKNYIEIIFSIFCAILLFGCGHSIYHKVEGTGVYGRIPLPNGDSLIEVAIGDLNITSGILRGGTTLDENTSKGGTFGTVSLGRHTHLSTIPAVNEGNIKAILTSPSTDPETKQLLTLYLISRGSLIPPPAAVTSVNSAASTGGKDEVPRAKATKTGLDNIVDNVAEVAPQVVQPIVDGTENVAKHVTTTVGDRSENVIKSFFNRATIIIISAIFICVIAAVFIIMYIIKRKKSKLAVITETVGTVTNIINSPKENN